MKGRPIDALVYEHMFKTSKLGECQNFSALLQRQLVPEVRLETAAFYGSLDSKEAQYPGLDYSYPPHRMRLSRFTWHRRLFRAFDCLGLTKAEIASLTKWEGTRWAKERFEKENNITIEDTTGKEIEPWVEPTWGVEAQAVRGGHEIEVEQMEDVEHQEEEEEGEEDGNEELEIESEEETESIGVELNERLRAAAERQENNGAHSRLMDAEFEQWLKENSDASEVDISQNLIFAATSNGSTRHSSVAYGSSSPRPGVIFAYSSPQPSQTSESSVETSTSPNPRGLGQVDGYRTPHPLPASVAPAAIPSPAATRRHATSTVHTILPATTLHWSRALPRQAQPPRS